MIFQIVGVCFLNYNTKPWACFGLYINWPLHYFFKASWSFVFLLHFNFDREFEAFSKEVDISKLIGSANSTKFY